MQLDDQQILDIENLSGCNYSPEQIAMYIDVDVDEFVREWHDENSQIRYRYERGKLLVLAESDMQLADSARKGNVTSYQVYRRSSLDRKFENLKKKILLDKELSDIDKLQALMEKGKADGLPAEMIEKYQRMDMVRSLYNKYNSKTFIINSIMLSYKDMSQFQAKKLYEETLNFFYADNDIKKDAWRNIYADKLDNAAILAFEMNDMENYNKLTMSAAKLRGLLDKDNEVKLPDDFYERRPVYYTMDPKDVGLPKADKRALAAYIDNLPELTDVVKNRLHADAQTNEAKGNFLDINTESLDFVKDEN